jgi:hypothetical protein
MWRAGIAVGLGVLIAAPPLVVTFGQTPDAREFTFSKDVAPIVFEHCVSCHRPGEVAPFSMLNYGAVRPWARSIRQEVLTRQMPPWFVVGDTPTFRNPRRLSDSDVRTIVAWVDGGAREGNPRDMPVPPAFDDTWQIGTPDLIVTMAEPYNVPAAGLILNAVVPTDYVFSKDTWVKAIEIRPGNRRVVHQAVAVLGNGGLANGLHLYSAGLEAMQLRDGYARFIPQGSRIFLRMHYITTGRETTDQTTVGLKFATGPVHTEVRSGLAAKDSPSAPLVVTSHQNATTLPLAQKARIHALRAHMPARGRQASAVLVPREGSRQPLLSLANWTDYWQYYYTLARPVEVPSGAFLEYTTDYDRDLKSTEEAHGLYFDWTELNEANKDDLEPIWIKVR